MSSRLSGMAFENAPLIHVVCPQCHASHPVRAPERDEVICYLCPRCLHFWDSSPVFTSTVRSFRLELA
jgi:hypothetical protein